MPALIRTIDQYFREEKRDLYYIVFGHKLDGSWRWLADAPANPAGRDELLTWFAEHLPACKIEPIYPFGERSGILCAPYPGSISVDFDEASLQAFCARWENAAAQSLDPRFQCYCYPLANYLEQHGGEYPAAPWDDPDWDP